MNEDGFTSERASGAANAARRMRRSSPLASASRGFEPDVLAHGVRKQSLDGGNDARRQRTTIARAKDAKQLARSETISGEPHFVRADARLDVLLVHDEEARCGICGVCKRATTTAATTTPVSLDVRFFVKRVHDAEQAQAATPRTRQNDAGAPIASWAALGLRGLGKHRRRRARVCSHSAAGVRGRRAWLVGRRRASTSGRVSVASWQSRALQRT